MLFCGKTPATRSIFFSPKFRRHFWSPTFRARQKSFVAHIAILIAHIDPARPGGPHPLICGFPSVFFARNIFARPPRQKSFVAHLEILIAHQNFFSLTWWVRARPSDPGRRQAKNGRHPLIFFFPQIPSTLLVTNFSSPTKVVYSSPAVFERYFGA